MSLVGSDKIGRFKDKMRGSELLMNTEGAGLNARNYLVPSISAFNLVIVGID